MASQSIPGQLIRKLAAQGNLHITMHAYERMDERQILLDEVVDAICHGTEIEVQPPEAENPDIRVLFQEVDGHNFYVVTLCRNMKCWVLSVCITEDEAWDVVKGILRRRSR